MGINCMKEYSKGGSMDSIGKNLKVRRDETIVLPDLEYYVNIKLNISTLHFITLPNLLDVISSL